MLACTAVAKLPVGGLVAAETATSQFAENYQQVQVPATSSSKRALKRKKDDNTEEETGPVEEEVFADIKRAKALSRDNSAFNPDVCSLAPWDRKCCRSKNSASSRPCMFTHPLISFSVGTLVGHCLQVRQHGSGHRG